MNTDKPKINRAELLAKARAAKAAKKEAAKEINTPEPIVEPVEVAELIDAQRASASAPVKKTKAKAKKTVEVKTLERQNSEQPPEIVEEVVKIPGTRRKKIVKRVIEIEESGTDEEIQEEIVRIPKVKNNVKFSREEMKNKLYQMNQQRLAAELFS
jgi:hypothetical protein